MAKTLFKKCACCAFILLIAFVGGAAVLAFIVGLVWLGVGNG